MRWQTCPKSPNPMCFKMPDPTSTHDAITPELSEAQVTGSRSQRPDPLAELQQDEARERLLEEVRQHPFWSRRAARRMKFTSIRKRSVYVYKLSSLCETRQIDRRYELSPGSAHANRPILGISPVIIPPPESLVRLRCNGDQRWSRRNSESSSGLTNPIGAQAGSESKAHGDKLESSSLTDISLVSTTGLCRKQSNASNLSSTSSLNKLRTTLEGSNVTPSDSPLINSDTVWSIRAPISAHRSARRMSKSQNKAESIVLPGSFKIDTCYACQGKGQFKCKSCSGDGTTLCIGCSGQGSTRALSSWSRASNKLELSPPVAECFDSNTGLNCRNDFVIVAPTESRRFSSPSGNPPNGSECAWISKTCYLCHGVGQNRCTKCSGKSHSKCELCQGSGSLRSYLNLDTIISEHADDELIANRELVPGKLLRLCTGHLLLEQSASRLNPLKLTDRDSLATERPQDCEAIMENIRLASRKLLKNHDKLHRDKLMIRQRQSLARVDCYLVRYQWRSKSGQFVIYGNERKVFIDKYPFKSCCNII